MMYQQQQQMNANRMMYPASGQMAPQQFNPAYGPNNPNSNFNSNNFNSNFNFQNANFQNNSFNNLHPTNLYNYQQNNFPNNFQNNNENHILNKKETFTIDKVREFPMTTVIIEREYDIIKEIGSGDYGKVLLATHKRTNTQVALKAVPKSKTPIKDFYFEFHYSYFLSPHQIILDTYDVAFETRDFYYFAQEVAPLGDLWQAVERKAATEGTGLSERDTKVIIQQLVKALEFMHEKKLVHRDMRAENVLVFAPDFSKVKLTDFGLTRKAGTLVKKRCVSLPTCPPEVWTMILQEGYHVELGSDVWQMGMFIFITTMARFPWEKADITDYRFVEFIDWQKRKSTKLPREFVRFTPRCLRLLRRLMDERPDKRYPITEVNKYFKDPWLKVVPKSVARNQTMPNRMGQTALNVPSLSIKRESMSNAMSANYMQQQPVSRSFSCSQLQYNNANNAQPPYGPADRGQQYAQQPPRNNYPSLLPS